jgi:hypothetical protein
MPDADVVAALSERLSLLEAERDIQRLMVKYAATLDYGDNEAWAQCFTADGNFDVRRRGEPLFSRLSQAFPVDSQY